MRDTSRYFTRLMGSSLLALLAFSATPASAQEDLQVAWQHDTGG